MQKLPTSLGLEQAGAEGTRPLVLVIEDHPATQKVISYMLLFQGYQPICATNGQEALEWIESALHTGQYPAAILLDLFMPIMDGTRFLSCLRSQWQAPVPLPPTILLTVDQGNHDSLACTDVLLKPFHVKELMASLKRVCSYTAEK
jgi:two-component system chemotaxis response regulator CheY